MNVPSTFTDKIQEPSRLKLAIVLANAINLGACHITEAPEGNVSSPPHIQKTDNEQICKPPESLTGESIPRHPIDVKARILAIKEYVEKTGIELPEIDFEEMEWGLIGPTSKKSAAEKILNYCHLNDDGNLFSREEIETILNANLTHSTIMMASINYEGTRYSSPLVEVTCDLSIQNEDYQCVGSRGECKEEARTDIGGVHTQYNGKSLILVENLKNTGAHELVHLINEMWEIDSEEDREKKFPAESLLNTTALELSGFKACHGVNYNIADQGGADAAQIALTSFENARTEIISATDSKVRQSDYQLKFYIFKHLLFEHLGDEADLEKRFNEAIASGELSYEDLITIGQFAFIISQEMIEEISHQL